VSDFRSKPSEQGRKQITFQQQQQTKQKPNKQKIPTIK
jgi:hypothetical protein